MPRCRGGVEPRRADGGPESNAVAAWPLTIPAIQASYNNSVSAPSGQTPNEVAYGFALNQPLDVGSYDKQFLPKGIARLEAADAIAFAQINTKLQYNRRHQPQFFRTGDYALIRLHYGYDIPATKLTSRKYGQQYIRPFQVLKRVGRLAYRLDIPPNWKIYLVLSIAQLELCPDPKIDPYHRERPREPPSVYVIGEEEHKIETILNKRVVRRGRDSSTEYLIK